MANKQLVIEILSDAKKFTSGLTEAINTISKATEKAEGFEKYTEQLEVMKKELLEVAQQTAQIGKNVRTGGEIVSQEQLNRIDALTSKVESIDKRFDSFRHTFGDMQNKLNGLSTRTLQVQLDKANASLDAFNQKYASLQQTLNIGLGAKLNNYKDIKQITNIGEMKAAYEDALKIFKSFSKETQKDGDNYSKAFTDAAAAVYKYSSALMFLNDIYYKHNSKKDYFSEDDFEKIQNTAFAAEDIIGNKLADNINNNIETGLKNINIKNYFEEIVGQVDSQTLTGALKNGGIIIPVKLDSNAFSILENEIKKDISALQSRANANPVKVHYETDTEELSKNIEKYFNELNTKLKKQVAELNTLMKGLVDDTGLKNTEQDFSSMAKLIPEMLRKVTEYSEQLKTITTDTKNSFENINSFTKEENFINYANAIKQTAESFKLLTSSLDDVSSKLSGNGLEGQFDILKKKFSELSIDTLTQEKTKENEQARKTKIKEIKELFALYSTYQSRGGIRPFSDLISGDADVNKKAYLQLAYNDYSKGKNKKENGTESVPFDAKQLKDILQILKDIKKTIEGINQIKIDTSELEKIITQAQGNNTNSFFTPQAITQIWSVLIQYANSYSESLNKVIEKLEIISKKEFKPLTFDSEELKKTYSQINNIIKLLEKGFNIGSFDQLNSLFDNIEIKFNSLLNDKGVLDLRKNKEELKEIYDLYYKYLNLGGEKSLSSLTSNRKNQQKLDSGYKKYLNDLTNEEERTQEKSLKDAQISEQIKQTVINSINEIKNAVNSLREDLNLLAEIMVTIGSSSNNIDYTEKFDRIRQSVEDILDVEFSDNSVDYRERFDNIQNEVTILNEKVKSLNDTLSLLDFDKINNIKISTEPFDRIIESLKEIIDLTERISGVPSKSKLDSQFKDIQKIYSSLVNDKGNFIVTKDKDAVQNLFSQYNKYKNFGGLKTLTDLDDSKVNVNKLSKYYNKYLDDISQQNESEVSTTSSIKDEAQNFIDIRDAANEATASKESFIKANKKLDTQTDKTSKSLEQEKTQFETFINDVKTLVTTDIESNNVVDFNTQILDSAKQTNEALKEELQYLQKLNEIQKTNPIKQNDIPVVSHNDSSKKQDSKKRISSFEKPDSEFDYEDLGLSYDPYLSAFQEFLLIAAEEAEKVKQQIISVAEFDNRLSEALTALYGQIPDLDDISASTGYGKNFNVTGATVSFRDKTTNDIYRKTFSLKKDKESGNFYIDQTTAILNDAEKYGKDNEKQAQKVLEWQTKLNAWLQSFSNKTSGTLDSTKDFQSLKNFNFTSEKDWINIKTIQQRLEGLYNEIVLNSTKGTSSLRPVPNMIYGQESRQTKKEKAESVYNRMALKWNGENGAEDTEGELKKLSSLYDNLQIEIKKFNEDGINIESVAQAYGAFNEQLNKVNEQLNRMKIVNTEINGSKINSLNNWFKDIPDPSSAEGKIEKYGQVYGQFVEAQQRLNELTTNLNRGTTEEDAQEYENRKEKIHEIVLELEEFKKILSSDSMNVNNQMGQVIKQNIPETKNIEELRRIINEYADARGKIIDSSETGTTIDKEGNEFVTFARKIQDTKGAVTEFEFTYNKAMGTIAVATKKVQEPESVFKTLADELTTKWRGFFTTLASFTGFTQLWGYFKQGLNTVREFDAALTEMQKVSNETISTLQDYQKTTFDTADAIGATALQIQNSTADFMRLGESLKEAAESAKVANILMNVSEFQSIDEATKSLIAMSAAYDDLSKMNIIDKLNEVGNNYAISTSEAATALQNSASALKTAGNDMDEALALITAGNAVVQDANKVGTGMRTIALRLTGTKSAKETLEDLGEETDSMLTTQSKLRDTIKEATAVASNGFKGFDILDDNGNYKSTYEIMLGIADVYNEILEADKQFGRNNANLLLESVAGKNRANIAASIFQNPQLLRDAYKSSQEAENSAIEENEKYMNSINGHIAQLQNAYQQMWANSMNRDTVNYFIDLGKSILQVVDNVGLLGTAFVSITGIKSIVGYQNGKGFAYEIIKGSKNAIKALAQTEGAMGSLASTAVSAGQAIKGSFSAAIPIIGGVGTAIALVAIGINAFIQHQKQVQKELVDSARATGEEWQTQKQTLSDYASQYEELKTKLDTGNLSEQETLQTKQEIYNIQKQITEQYGKNVDKIDLVNGQLREQLDIINNISQAEANRVWNSGDYQKGFNIAKEAMTSEKDYSFKEGLNPYDYKTPEDEALSYIIQKYTQERKYSKDSKKLGTYRVVSGNPIDADKRILEMIEQIEKLQIQYSDNKDFQKRANDVLESLRGNRDKIDEIRKNNEDVYLQGLPIELMATKGNAGYKIYSDYQSSVSNLESAYISGDTKKINEAREAFEEATKAKDEFLKLPSNNQYSMLFDNIDTSIIDTKNRTEDATKALKNALQLGDDLSRFDEYEKQKAKADAIYKDLGNLQKVGNIDNGNRPFIFWDAKEVKKQQKALESWGQSIEDVVGGYSTVFGGSGQFDGVDIAFTPIINDGTGKGKLLTKETLYNYINTLIANAGEGWTNDELFKLDAEGLIIDGQHISNVLGVVGNSMSEMGLTAEEVGEMMHDWQAESIGYIANFQDEWKKAIKQGKTFDEFMQDQEKDLKDITKATNKYSKEDKRLYQALKRVIDLDIDRVDAEQAFDASANGSQIYRNALENLMNALGYTIDDSGLMIDMLVANSIIHGDVADATNSASDAYNQFSQEIATAIENVSKLNTVLTESVSGAGISTQNIDAFKEMFGDDYVYALERSANGYHINAEKLQTLIDKQNALTNSDYQKTLDAQYDALKRCNDEIIKANNEQKDTSGLLAQRQGILQRIQDTQDLMMAYQASTSAFQTWTNAQSNGNEYDMYDKIANGYDTVKDLIDRGWSGDDTVRSYLDLIYGDSFDAFTASGEECAEMFDNLDKKIEGTSFSIRDFFQFDSSGKITSNGIFNFFDALKEKQDQLGLSDNEKWIKDDGTYDFGFGRDRAAAEQLGIDVEFFQSMLRAAVSAGFELNLDQPMWAMDELEKKAIKAQEELGGFNDIDFEELYNNLDDEDAYETISGHIDDVYDYIQKIEDSDLSPELKTQQIEQAQDMLSYLVALEREAADKGDINLKATVVGSAKEELGKLIEETDELPEALKQYNWDEITDKDGLQKARNYIAAEIEGGRIDSSSAEAFLNILDQALDELNLIDEYEANPTIQGNTVGAFNDVKQAREELKKYIADAQQLEKDYDIKFNFSEDEKVQELLSKIYGEGTPEILASLDIDPDKTPEEIIEMLESGERNVDVLLKPDSSELEKSVQNSGKTVVTNAVNKQTNSVVNETKNLVTEYTEQITNASMDTSDYDEGLEHIEEGSKQANEQKIEPKAGMDTKDFDKKAGNTESKVRALNNLNAVPSVTLGGASQVASAAESMRSQIASIKGKTVSVVANFSHSGLGAVKEAINSVVSKVSEAAAKLRGGLANGTAHVRGTAFARGSVISNHAYASGKWGLPDDQTALTGELGTEIVVRDGNWFTVGDDGAEFVNLKKGDIVFNHKQSEELLENGYVTSNKGRGHLVGFANGTAYSSGNTSGATRARVATSSSKSGSSRGSSSGSGGSGGSGNSGGNNSSSNNAKETKNTLDEVEILIGRIEARISDLDKIIGSTYNTWEDRNDSIIDNLRLVTQEISDQRNAYTTYMNKANSIGLSESWKQKIRDGAFRIEDVTDSDLWDKIQEYQTWYNKAVQSEQALIDLTNKRGELYKQLFDNTQTYYDNMVEAIQHEIDIQDTFIDRLEEAGRLSSKILIYRQFDQEQQKLVKLNEELQTLKEREKDALNSGYIEYGSETWSEMESAIADVCAAIEEAENNLISYDKALNEVDWSRWDRIHDSIDGVVNELEFIYDLINEDDLFTEQGDITDQGTTALALLAHEYDVYFAEVQEYQKEINQVQEDLAKDPYNQALVDKLKELKEAQQDAASGAKKMKESIVDVTEKGIKKQIDYVKKLIEDYEELLETQKDQIDYAKKVADQQKELNKLEKQYRAIQNDDSEETATRRQQLKNQIEEARESLKETQDDRRLSETKDMLSKFEESFEEFLENKLKDVEGLVREAIDTANTSRGVIKDTINDLASSYGYTPSDTLKSTLDDLSRSFVTYFNGQFENDNVASIADNVSKIVDYYQRVQKQSNEEATHDTMTEAVRHDGNIQTYRDENGNTVSGYFRSDGTRDETYTGWAEKQGKQYRFENGELLTGSQFVEIEGKKYHLDESGAVQTGWQKIDDQLYYMNNQGEMQTGWVNLDGRWYYMNDKGQAQIGANKIDGKQYVFDETGAMLAGGWRKYDDNWYHLGAGGVADTGWLRDNDKWYYLNDQGEMQTGFQKVDGKQYVFDESGAMLAGGWRKYNDQWYHLGNGGIADTGWLRDNNKWYYLNDKGEMQTGVQRISGKTYIMGASGAMLSNGWQKANGQWYYLNTSGVAQTGWQRINGQWYYLDDQGAMKTGFYSENGKTYYLSGSGAMATGWQKINGSWYYFNGSGVAASGWTSVDGKWYYFDPDTKVMAVNSWIDGGGVTTNPQKGAYYVGASGAMVKDGRQNTNMGWLTFEKNGKWTGYKTGTSGVGTSGLYWTNEGNKAEAIIRKSDGAILTPLSKGDSVIPNSAMKNMYQALTDPAKYLKQYTTPDVRVIQSNNNSSNQPPVVNMQFIANGVQDANRFVNDLMNNKKLEKWVQEITLGQANGHNSFRKYSYTIR